MTEPSQLPSLVEQADALLKRSAELVADASSHRWRRSTPVSIQPLSANRKLAPQRRELATSGRYRNVPIGPFVASTYVSIEATCPDTCAFRGAGCFAEAGSAHLTMRGLNDAARGWPALEVTRAEARAIDGLWVGGIPQTGARGGVDLRLHVGGEVSCANGARELGEAASRWLARGGGLVWSFTHRWQTIPRRAWGPISVLASVDDPAEIAVAAKRGYPSAVVVEQLDGHRVFPLKDGWRGVPCPAEVSEDSRSTCASCRLCLNADRLLARKLVIVFGAHGRDEDLVKIRLSAQDEA